jgi:hypothetical protein
MLSVLTTRLDSSLSTPLLEMLGRDDRPNYGLHLLANYTAMEGVFLPALRELYGDFTVNGSVSAYVRRWTVFE